MAISSCIRIIFSYKLLSSPSLRFESILDDASTIVALGSSSLGDSFPSMASSAGLALVEVMGRAVELSASVVVLLTGAEVDGGASVVVVDGGAGGGGGGGGGVVVEVVVVDVVVELVVVVGTVTGTDVDDEPGVLVESSARNCARRLNAEISSLLSPAVLSPTVLAPFPNFFGLVELACSFCVSKALTSAGFSSS